MNDVSARTNNPFGDSQPARPMASNAVANTDQQRAIAEVQAASLRTGCLCVLIHRSCGYLL